MLTIHPLRVSKIVSTCAYRQIFKNVGRSFSSTRRFVHVNVGGIPFSIALSDIEKFPGSIFQRMINSSNPISIQRDGALFKFVNAYIVNGHLPRDKDGLLDLDDATLDGLKEEADFYGLNALSKECNIQRHKNSELDLNSYLTIRKYIASLRREGDNLKIDLSSRLVHALKCMWSPFCVRGRLYPWSWFTNDKYYGASSFENINLDELIAAATQSPFGRGTETVIDTSVRNSFEINASLLDASALNTISNEFKCNSLAPRLDLTLRPYKLVIYKEGGHFDAHRDTVRGDGHIGTLVVILNSEYTGGELEVTHGDCTEVVTGPYSWVAMYGDCLHKINPVTSGTRVSLIYDIYGTEKTTAARVAVGGMDNNEQDEGEEETVDESSEENANQDEENDEEIKSWSDNEDFWEVQPKGRDTYREFVTAAQTRGHPNDADIARVFEALDLDLKSLDSVIICLQHLYPECQTNPAFLKGGDRVLYDILTRSGSEYEVEVVAATIYRQHEYEYIYDNKTQFALFSPTILKRSMGHVAASPGSEKKNSKTKHDDAALGRTKLVIPNNLDPDSLLDYTPYAEYTGNEAQAEESVYIVAGLLVRRKE